VPLRVLSLGAGVQSTTLLMLIFDGEISADAAIFADTGWEPRAVYDHLERLRALCDDAALPLHIVSAGRSIRTVDGDTTAGRPPLYLRGEHGDGMLRRQCTKVFKVQPIRRKIRELLADSQYTTAEQLLGISIDELQRARTSDVKYITNVYPLIDRRMSRADCIRYLERRSINAPRSACIGCPYHSDAEWRRLRDESPDEFADAVAYEQELQADGLGLRAVPYLHRQRVPLNLVDLSTREDHGQMTLSDECEGLCGV
jgi:hypothetical protein